MLFRHEIAFVFGQLLSPHSVPSLLSVLQNLRESDMVRHEAAEALGGIATPEVLPQLKIWMNREDAPRVVRESCQIAIDMWEVCILFVLGALSDVVHDFVVSMRIRTSSSMPMVSILHKSRIRLAHDANSVVCLLYTCTYFH